MTKLLFVGSGYDLLYRSLRRSLHFQSRTELEFFTTAIENLTDYKYVITYNYDESLTESCKIIYDYQLNPSGQVILGYNSESCDIDLKKLSVLNSFLFNKSKYNIVGTHITFPFFKKQINLFFRGHGENSLLEVLNYSFYYLNNYNSLLFTGEYDKEKLQIYYLKPGFESWKTFTRRFGKYESLLYSAGWNNRVLELDKAISEIDSEIKLFENSALLTTFDKESVIKIDRIFKTFEEISSQFNERSGKTISPGS